MEVAVTSSGSAWHLTRGGSASVRIPVPDASRIGEARRAADAIARGCGLDERARGALGIVVTEAATNLARHARDGVVLLRGTSQTERPGVEMLAIDRGPGMEDLSRFFVDGFSTGGTSGHGLGAMKRQAHQLDVYSQPGAGTVALARVFPTGAAYAPQSLDVGAVCVPLEGETVSGDGWYVHQDADRATVLLADGLGHGPNAAEAACAAIDAFRSAAGRTPKEIVAHLHDALRSTRGAAVAVADIRKSAEGGATIDFCGVGNTVSALVGTGTTRSLPSMNGTAGLSIGRPQEFSFTWEPAATLVMHTDGITSRWRLDAYRGIGDHDPAVTAAVLYRDFNRGRDDATVLALRQGTLP